MTINRMTIDDLKCLKLDEPWMYERFRNYFQCNIGPAFIVTEAGLPVCAFGALFEWGNGGACEVWFNLISNNRAFSAAKLVKRKIKELAESFKITRMQAIVKCESKINNRFMEFMGFVNETPNGMKNKLHTGQTAYMYSRCF